MNLYAFDISEVDALRWYNGDLEDYDLLFSTGGPCLWIGSLKNRAGLRQLLRLIRKTEPLIIVFRTEHPSIIDWADFYQFELGAPNRFMGFTPPNWFKSEYFAASCALAQMTVETLCI